MTAVCALIFAAALSGDSDMVPVMQEPTIQTQPGPITAAIAAAPAIDAALEPWMVDKGVSRPRVLGVMYGTFGALQALDVYSTYRSLNAGATEVNPVARKAASSPTAMIALKAASTAASIYFAERSWKSNRKGAVVLMAIINGVTAAVVANNLRHSRGRR